MPKTNNPIKAQNIFLSEKNPNKGTGPIRTPPANLTLSLFINKELANIKIMPKSKNPNPIKNKLFPLVN